MKLDYGSLISPTPLKLNICSIKSPTLREISNLSAKFKTYNGYLSIILTDIKSYYRIVENEEFDYFSRHTEDEKKQILKIKKEYEGLVGDEKLKVRTLDVFHFDKQIIKELQEALSFFICEKILYSFEDRAFIVYNEDKVIGAINSQSYPDVTDIILQMNWIHKDILQEDKTKVKNKKALEILEKLNKAKTVSKKADERLEFPNIISSIAAYHNSINMLNIWDLTIYQIYDLFERMQSNTVFDIKSIAVAFGAKDDKFNAGQWFDYIKR